MNPVPVYVPASPQGNATVSEAGEAAPRVPWMLPLEALAAALMTAIVLLLFAGVLARYVLSTPIIWIDEVVAISFAWLAMIGAVIAMHRNEHLRLTLFLALVPEGPRRYVHAFALVAVAAFLLALVGPAWEYVQGEWVVLTPVMEVPNSLRAASLLPGIVGMLILVMVYAWRTVAWRHLLVGTLAVAAVAGACWLLGPQLRQFPALSVFIFLGGFVVVCLAAGVPIGFCFGIGTLSFLAFTTQNPLTIVISRMDEGMSSFILVSVPVFVLLGCILDHTGMGKAIIDFLASLVGHIKAGLSYVLLGSLFIVSGISGSKVSDMASVAPALFPEMEKRGHRRPEMIALLATGAAMADTVPPSIILIVLGSVTGLSIAGLFQSGFVVAMVLLAVLLVLARWKARHEVVVHARRPAARLIIRVLLIAAPALALPFLIRGAIGGGVATATEVSTIAVLYALLIGQLLYGGVGPRKLYRMLVETASLSGAILLILGTASGMAWAVTQSGLVQALSHFLTTLPGGAFTFLAVTIVVFMVLGCVLEGLPAVLLMAPIMFPIARTLGIHEIHYAMVVVTAMNVGLMTPPIGIGFYIACRVGGASPDTVMRAIWPYLIALLVGVIVIAAVPWISTVAL